MKTSELVNTLSRVINGLFLEEEAFTAIIPTTGQPQQFSRISGITSFKQSVKLLEKTKLLPEQVKQLKSTALYTNVFQYETGPDEVTLPLAQGRQIISQAELLSLLANQIYNALSSTIMNDNSPDSSINVRLPDNVKDFGDLEKFSHDINLALNQIITDPEIGGHVQITNVETGSIWLSVYLGSAAAVTLTGKVLWAAAVIYKKKKESDLLSQYIRNMSIKNDSLEEIQKAQKLTLSQLIDAEASHINNENFLTQNPERVERLKHSVELFSKLIEQGTEIYPALAASEGVANLFPDPKNLLNISSQIKQIENQ